MYNGYIATHGEPTMTTFVAHASCHDAHGEYSRRNVSEAELQLMTLGRLIHPKGRSIEGDEALRSYDASVEEPDRAEWDSLGTIWQARNALMLRFKWDKWSARTLWMVK